MNESTKTKKALRGSLFALFLCIVLLIGTTFAWFTDTASTGVNKIQSGNLDVALEMQDANENWVSAEGETLTFKTEDGRSAEQILWEPGCRYELPKLRVVNKGNLALKYKLKVTGVEGDKKLNEVIDWTIDGTPLADQEGKLTAKQEGNAFTIKGVMQESAGNEYQGLSIDGISITVYATQDTVESDSFGPDYDQDAKYTIPAGNANELTKAINAAVAGLIQLDDLSVASTGAGNVVTGLAYDNKTGKFTVTKGLTALTEADFTEITQQEVKAMFA